MQHGSKKMKKARILGFLVFFLCGTLGWTQRQTERPYWFSLEQGKSLFRKGDYGNALLAFEDARRDRRELYTRMEQDLIDLLSIPEVRLLGDSLDQIEPYIAERYQVNAAAALRELYFRVPRSSLEGSATRALEALGQLKYYPEAEYWIGESYRVEGELGVALGQYQKAHEQRVFLENPGFDIEILYKIIDIHKIKQNYTEMEKRLLETLERDTLWAGRMNLNTKSAMLKVLENDGISRFLTVYRYNNSLIEQTHRLLGFYYYTSGRYNRAVEHLMFSCLIQNTIVIEEVIRNQYDFTFTSLENLLTHALKRPTLVDYIERSEYYKTLYYMGAALYGDGKLVSARRFWTFLSGCPDAGEWGGRASSQLRSPFVEQMVEMP
jgi:tetratricopeptide (TPR) repeat protein